MDVIKTCCVLVVTAIAIMITGNCRNPFFPPTGTPDRSSVLRATPAGVIEQLVKSYQLKRLDLYQDLFPRENTFQFYVTPAFDSAYQSRPYSKSFPPEPRDTMLYYIGEYSYYYYWKQDVEMQSHKKLFSRVDKINFTFPHTVNPGDFRYRINETGDTTNVEMLLTGGEFEITITVNSVPVKYTVSIDKQVFYLERDPDNLWVIRKWYDFGSMN